MTHRASIPWAILLLLIVAGCGQSGSLYLPSDPSEVEVSSPPAENQGEEDDDDEDEDDEQGDADAS